MADPIETGEVSRTTTGNHVHSDERPAVLDGVEAGQGSRRMLNMRVLIVSLFLCAFAALLAYWLFW